MKIPVKWLQDYVKTDKSPKEIAASFTQLGLMLDKPLGDGKVLDLEHRMDRSDWLSIIGCARDYAAFENLPLSLPKAYGKAGKKPDTGDIIPINVECTDFVRRFNTRVFRGVKVAASPAWLIERLEAYGLPSINNVVDITNFVMVEYGQPLHAQDLSKLPAPELTWRRAKKNEKITTLLGTELKLDETVAIISSGDKPVVVGGIVGGIETGVRESTTDFILDAGTYDQRSVRHASRQLKIANETVLRCDKFLDPRLTEHALARATGLILELAGGTYYDNVDWYPHAAESKSLTVRESRLRLLSGMDLTLGMAQKILTRLGYVVTEQSDDTLTLEIPYFRTDVEVEDDIVADILRIGNYTNIPTLPLTSPVPVDITPVIYTFEDRMRDILAAAGCHEHITGSLVPSDNNKDRIVLQNALTSEQSALRVSIEETLDHVLAVYHKHGLSEVAIFEIGKVYWHIGKGVAYTDYKEERRLTVVSRDQGMLPYLLATILKELGVAYRLQSENGAAAIISGETRLGYVLPGSFTLFTENLMPIVKPYASVTSEYAHPQSLDLSYSLSHDVTFGEIHQAILTASPNISNIQVLEKTDTSLLIRVMWADADVAKEKSAINQALMALDLVSRSG